MAVQLDDSPSPAAGRAIGLALEAHILQVAADAACGTEQAGLSIRAERLRDQVRTALSDMDVE